MTLGVNPRVVDSGGPLDADGTWHALATAVIARRAVPAPHPPRARSDQLAGLVLDDEQVDALLVEITGAGDTASLDQVAASLDPVVARARQDFAGIPAVELDAVRHVGRQRRPRPPRRRGARRGRRHRARPPAASGSSPTSTDDVTSRRLELATLGLLFDADHPGARAVGPDAAAAVRGASSTSSPKGRGRATSSSCTPS